MKKGNAVLIAVLILAAIYTFACNKSYKTVKIGEQEWMAENLNVEHYRNGDVIPEVKDSAEWSKLTTGAWCYYENDTNNGKVYGKMYNWYAVNDPRGLAPEGWHVPTDEEWTQLTDYLGGDGVSGKKMKSTSGWYGNVDGTNETGFSAFPGGIRAYYGDFGSVGKNGDFWSASEYSDTLAWTRNLFYSDSRVYRGYGYKGNGLSIRCLRD